MLIQREDPRRHQTGQTERALSSGDLIPLGEIVAGLQPGRRDDSGIVYYNSVGIGVQDAAAALTIVDAARGEPG